MTAPISMEASDRETECVNAELKGTKAESYYSRLEEQLALFAASGPYDL